MPRKDVTMGLNRNRRIYAQYWSKNSVRLPARSRAVPMSCNRSSSGISRSKYFRPTMSLSRILRVGLRAMLYTCARRAKSARANVGISQEFVNVTLRKFRAEQYWDIRQNSGQIVRFRGLGRHRGFARSKVAVGGPAAARSVRRSGGMWGKDHVPNLWQPLARPARDEIGRAHV